MAKKITEERFNLIKQFMDASMTYDNASKLFHISGPTISRIKQAETYQDYQQIMRGQTQKKAAKNDLGEINPNTAFVNELSTLHEAMLAMLNSQKHIIGLLEDIYQDVQLSNIK